MRQSKFIGALAVVLLLVFSSSNGFGAAKKAAKEISAEDAAIDAKNASWGVDVGALKKKIKKNKCKSVVMYREVIPYFGMDKTKEISKQIAIGVQKEDVKSGKAKVINTKYDCNQILGNLYVMCTTDVTLCYVK